jgi:fructokinase
MSTSNTIEVVCFGEVLFDLFEDGPKLGGAPFNVCAHLNNLGVRAEIVSAIGQDELGQKIKESLHSLGMDGRYIQELSNMPTGVVEVDAQDRHEVNYTIIENVAWDGIELSEISDTDLGNLKAFVYGSLAARSDKSRDTLTRLLDSLQCPKVMDVNLRAPFDDKNSFEDLLYQADILKLNEFELRKSTCLHCIGLLLCLP